MKPKTVFSILAVAACVASHASRLKFDITSDHEDATYKLGEQAVFTVKALDASGAPHAGYAAYNVCPSKKKAIFDSIGWGHDASKGKGGPALAKWISEQDKAAD